MSIVITGNKIPGARLITLKHMLHLEIKGMKRRGRSAYSIIKEELGFRGSRQRVHDQLEEYINEQLFDGKE